MERVGARSWYFSCLILMHFVHSSNPCSDIWWNNQMSHYIMILQGGCYIYSIYRNIHTQLICWLFKSLKNIASLYRDILKSQTLKRKPVILSIEIQNFIKLYKTYFFLSIMVLIRLSKLKLGFSEQWFKW